MTQGETTHGRNDSRAKQPGTVNSLGLDFTDLLPVTLSISYRCLNLVSNTDFYAICSHYYHFSNRIVTNIIFSGGGGGSHFLYK